MIAGVALSVHAGAPLLLPAALLVALIAFECQPTTRRYLVTISSFLALALITGIVYSIATRTNAVSSIFIVCGLILIVIGRIRGPR